LTADSRSALDFGGELVELDTLAERAAAASAFDRALYLEVRALELRVTFRNPLLEFEGVSHPFDGDRSQVHSTPTRASVAEQPRDRASLAR